MNTEHSKQLFKQLNILFIVNENVFNTKRKEKFFMKTNFHRNWKVILQLSHKNMKNISLAWLQWILCKPSVLPNLNSTLIPLSYFGTVVIGD